MDFEVVEGRMIGNQLRPRPTGGDTKCLLCEQVVKAAHVHDAGRVGDMDARLTAVVLQPHGRGGKRYRRPTHRDLDSFKSARMRATELRSQSLHGLPVIPDEPLAYHPQYMIVRGYGLDEWGKLFNDRQLLALTTFAHLTGKAHAEMLRAGLDAEYARAVTTYLGLAVDRLANQQSTLSRWHVTRENLEGTFARQALPMVWDFAEGNPMSGATGDFAGALAWIAEVVIHSSIASANSADQHQLLPRTQLQTT